MTNLEYLVIVVAILIADTITSTAMKRKALDRNIIDGLREPKQERKDVRPRDDDKKKKTSAMIKNEAHQPPTARSETSATSKDQASHQVLSSAPTTNEEASSPTAKKQAAARRKLLNASDVDASDDLLAREWNEMSRKERERTQEEVHGVVSAAVEEAPEFVRKRIGQMDDEISKYRKKFAYDRALFFSPSDVKDRNFSLLFLRAVDFHPRKAADRMIAFFELKLELFGIETLVRPITLDDITEEDKEPLEAGTHQFLPEKDRAGRAVFCGLFNLFKAQRDTRTQVRLTIIASLSLLQHILNGSSCCSSSMSSEDPLIYLTIMLVRQCRSLFYQIMVGLEDDIEAQKKGVVLVLHAYQFDDDMLRMEEMIKSFSIFFKALPWKPMGIHYCCPKEEMSTLRPFEQFFQLVIGKEGRKRFRTHHGKPKHAPSAFPRCMRFDRNL